MTTEGYYIRKDSSDDWTVHGRRHHLQIVRTEGPSGREDRHGNEIYQSVFLVKDRSGVINLEDQYDEDAHGYTRLKDAFKYAVEKLIAYDNRVDPRKKARKNPGSARMAEVLEAWDILVTFMSYERTPRRIEWLRRTFEIQGSIDEWIENKLSNVIDEYASLRGISFEAAQAELQQRPRKQWGIERPLTRMSDPAEAESQFQFHLKPSGWTGAPCPICGCATPNLRAKHRALKADEAHLWGVPYIKRVKVAFGTDFSDEPLKE